MTETIEEFSTRVASATPTPAGGSVAALTGGLAAALVAMVGRIAQNREESGHDPAIAQLVEQAEQLRGRLLGLVQADAQAYAAVLEAKRSTAGSEAEREARVNAAWRRATHLPAEVVRLCRETAMLARRAARAGTPGTVGDAVMAALLAAAVAAGSQVNLRINLKAAGRPQDLRVLAEDSEILLRDTQRAASETRLMAEERLGGKE
jgi:glutamate formiminotransferase/formiminotetrahydrofolate cyclodeaminase